ncbi:MAG: ATPase domain, partial [Pseudomonadota bacterium]
MALKTHVVGRSQQSESLRRVLLGQTRGDGRLTIQSIEGPGGIGKTTLLDHVRSGTPLTDRRYLRLSLRGQGSGLTSAFQAVQSLVKSASIDGVADASLPSRFPEVHRVSAAFDRLVRDGIDTLQRDPDLAGIDPKVLLRLFDAAVAFGKPLNQTIKVTRDYLDFDEIARHREKLERGLGTLAPFLAEAPRWIDRIRPGGTFVLRNALRTNALEPLAVALEQDLRTILDARAPLSDILKPRQSGHGKVERLLLEIDDYESTSASIGRLLVDHLLPKLARAPFDTLVVMLGRDQLVNTDPGWAQHFGRNLCEPIVLDTLTRPEVDELCAFQGIESAADRERVWNDTRGYPLQVELWLDEMRQSGGQPTGGPSATAL